MGNKGRLILSFVSLFFAISLITVGVYCAVDVTYIVSGKVHYEVPYDVIPYLEFSVDGSAKTATITGYSGSPTDLSLPTTISVVQLGDSNLFIEGTDYKVTAIDDYAFESCDTLKSVTIPYGVKTIGNACFTNSTLTSISIPSSVTDIGLLAFSDCEDLTSISVNSSNNYYYTDSYGVLFTKNKSELIQYPSGNTRTSYSIPSGVKVINQYSFWGSVNLKSIVIPSGVTQILDRTFTRCTSLTSITIPNSVTSLGNHAFNGCTALTSFSISRYVTQLGEWTFVNCTSLKSISVNSSNPNYSSDSNGVLYNKNKTTLIQYPTGKTATSYTIPSTVQILGTIAFRNCAYLQTITIPTSVEEIGSYAFVECSNLDRAIFLDSDSEWSIMDFPNYRTIYVEDETPESMAEHLTYYNGNPITWNKIS